MNNPIPDKKTIMPSIGKEIRWIRLLLTIIALPVLFIILKTLKAIFVPLVFAIFLSFVFSPLINNLAKRKVPMGIILLVLIVTILLFFAMVGGVIYASITSFITDLPLYISKLTVIIQEFLVRVHALASSLDNSLAGYEVLDLSDLLSGSNLSLTRVISGTMGTFMDFGVNIFLTFFFLLFIVTGNRKLEKRLIKVLTEDHKTRTLSTILNIELQIQKYLFNKTLIALSTAVIGMLFMVIFRIDFVIVAGVFFFVLYFIPNIGSIVSCLFPILICLVNYGFGWRLVGLTASLLTLHMIFGNIIEPRIMGERLNLNPIMVLISLIFWGWVWGIVGMLVAVPLTSAINIIIKQLDEENVVSALISDE